MEGPLYELLRRCTVRLSASGIQGTGFFVAPDLILTCAHVVKKAGLGVIPVILRPTDWKTSPFGGLMPLPRDGKPITKWSDRDEAFLEVTQGIRKVAEGLKNANPR